MLETLKHYRRISDTLHTMAQPTVTDFPLLKQAGIELIINLSRADSPDAIIDEARLVQENAMHYLNIPVDFKKPDQADLELFFSAMEQHHDKTMLVHCAYNWRVSSFVYLYRVIKQGTEPEIAKQDMLAIWQPDETWQAFIDDCLAKQEALRGKAES